MSWRAFGFSVLGMAAVASIAVLMPEACDGPYSPDCVEFNPVAEAQIYEPVKATPLLPRFLERPTAQDYEAVYPEAALRQRISGRGVLGCTILPDGQLDCVVLEETPVGYGFGAAALALAPKFQVSLKAGDGTSAFGKLVRIPIHFQLE